MTELFLALITLLTTRTKDSDRPVALVFCLVGHMTYFANCILPTEIMFHFMAASEALTVVMLVCFRGCSTSKLTDLLIPVSLFAVFIDVYGWAQYRNNQPLDAFSDVILLYYGLIIAIFIYVVITHDRVHSRAGRLFRDNRNYNSLLENSHKC